MVMCVQPIWCQQQGLSTELGDLGDSRAGAGMSGRAASGRLRLGAESQLRRVTTAILSVLVRPI
jgi:hypothetical protein